MKLKNLYSLSIFGIFLTGFGGGWILLSQILELQRSSLDAIGLGTAAIGIAIMIKTLSTIRKIDIVIEDEHI